MSDNSNSNKARYWAGVLYPENMDADWEDGFGDKIQLPFSYVVHDKDVDKQGELRKAHVDLILAWPSPTTYKNALSVFQSLTADGKPVCINKVERINSIRSRYNYQVHDTDDCRKKHKHRYDDSERHTGNGFDIGSYEQLGVAEKNDMTKELALAIVENGFTNFTDFFMYAQSNYGDEYFEIIKTYSGLFERLTKGNYQKKLSGELNTPKPDGSKRQDAEKSSGDFSGSV